MTKYNIAVATSTEGRQPGYDQRIVNGGSIIHSGGPDPTKGVALLLRPPISDPLIMWHPISSRLLYAGHRYGHHSNTNTQQRKTTVQSVPRRDGLLTLGDLNAYPNDFWNIIGPFIIGSNDDNSHRFLSLCSSLDLMVTGTWFKIRHTDFPWQSRQKVELCHILARSLTVARSY